MLNLILLRGISERRNRVIDRVDLLQLTKNVILTYKTLNWVIAC